MPTMETVSLIKQTGRRLPGGNPKLSFKKCLKSWAIKKGWWTEARSIEWTLAGGAQRKLGLEWGKTDLTERSDSTEKPF